MIIVVTPYKDFRSKVQNFLKKKVAKRAEIATLREAEISYRTLVGQQTKDFKKKHVFDLNAKTTNEKWQRWLEVCKPELHQIWNEISPITGDHIDKLVNPGIGALERTFALHYRLHREFELPEFAKSIDQNVFGRTFESEFGEPVFKILAPPPVPTGPFEWPDHLSQDVVNRSDMQPSIWLNPHNHYSLKLSERKKEKNKLNKFAGDPRPFLMAVVIGPSGAGKTRLISEWMKGYMAKYQDNGWDAGFIRSINAEHLENWEPQKNTALIIDYTHNYGDVIQAIFSRFKDWPQGAPKVRLLLLDHIFPKNIFDDLAHGQITKSGTNADTYLGHYMEGRSIELTPETEVDSKLLHEVAAHAATLHAEENHEYKPDNEEIKNAVAALLKIGASQKDQPPTDDEQRSMDAVRHPLFAALLGQWIAHNPGKEIIGWTRRDLIDNYFSTGRRIPWEEHTQNPHHDTLGIWAGCYICAATLMRGLSIRHANRILTNSSNHPDGQNRDNQIVVPSNRASALAPLQNLCNRIVADDNIDSLKPFEPDILGEAFLLKFVEEFDINNQVFEILIKLLSTHEGNEQEKLAVFGFLQTLDRLVRNLINDDQNDIEVTKAWTNLLILLDPKRFPEQTPTRKAVSIALCNAIKQLRAARLEEHIPKFVKQVIEAELRAASDGFLWEDVAVAYVHYFDWKAARHETCDATTESLKHVLSIYRDKSEQKLPALMLPAFEGTLSTIKEAHTLFKEDINATQVEGWTILMAASYAGHPDIVDWLIKRGADPNLTKIADGWTALMAACQEGHLDVVDRLIKANAAVNQGRKDNGCTALMAASLAGHLDVVDRLIKADAAINQGRKDNGGTALMAASFAGHLDVVDRLIKANAAINQVSTDIGGTALMDACVAGHLDVVDRLIKANAAINQVSTDVGGTALMAASSAGHLDVVDRLIKADAAVNQVRKDNGCTALMAASSAGHLDVVDRLIKANAAVNQVRKDNGGTALMDACVAGHLDVVDRLIKADAAVNQVRTDNGRTALMAASSAGHLDVVDRLIKANAAINQVSTDIGGTALMDACVAGHLDVVDRLIKANAAVNQVRTDNGRTALIVAYEKGHLDVVDRLIKANAAVNQGDDDGWTVLMVACVAGHLDVVDRLIKANAAVDQGNDNGWTALMVACEKGHLDVVDRLIKANAAVNQGDDYGWTALMVACVAGHLDVVDRLIKANAAVNQGRKDNGWTALSGACAAGHLDVVDRLIKADAAVDQGNDHDWTALMVACKKGHLDVVDRLIKANAAVNQGDDDGWTALMVASGNGHIYIVDLLLKAGADANLVTEIGYTALICAALTDSTEIVSMLLDHEADITSKTKSGETALSVAIDCGNSNVVALLKQHGATK